MGFEEQNFNALKRTMPPVMFLVSKNEKILEYRLKFEKF